MGEPGELGWFQVKDTMAAGPGHNERALRKAEFRLRTQEIKINIKKDAHYQEIMVSPNWALIQCPCRMVLVGPTLSGKSRFLMDCVEHRTKMFTANFQRIIYCYPEATMHTDYMDEMRGHYPELETNTGLPNIGKLGLKDDTCHKVSYKL